MIVHAAKEYCRGESGASGLPVLCTRTPSFYVLGLPVLCIKTLAGYYYIQRK